MSKRSTVEKDSLSNLLLDANQFSLENNDNAQNYFDGKDVNKIIKKVKRSVNECKNLMIKIKKSEIIRIIKT